MTIVTWEGIKIRKEEIVVYDKKFCARANEPQYNLNKSFF